jgi:hypothetical protein
MLLGIDHLVVAVRSVEAAEAELSRALGVAFTGGGRHEAMGTYNRLAFVGDSFIELIGVFDRGLVEAAGGSFPVGDAALAWLDAGRQGLVTFALATDDVAGEVALLRMEGSSIGEPLAGSRTRADGEVVRWSTAFPPALSPELPPFLIEHELAGAEWGAEARAARAAFQHPGGGGVRLTTLELPVGDAESVADTYGKVLGIAFSEGWRAAIGEQSIVLVPDGAEPVVELGVDAGTPPLDAVRLGIRWRRVARPLA